MPGKNFHLTPLESRKQLLLVESELNRAQLLNELRDLGIELHQVKEQVRTIGSIATSIARLAAIVSAIGSVLTHREAGQNGKSSWLSTLLSGVRTGASIWEALRSHPK